MVASTGLAPPGITVCVIDDHDQLRDILVRILTTAGMVVLAAEASFDAGERAVLEHLPDVAVIDNQLPDGQGVDLCRQLRLSAPQVRLILHSGMVTPGLEAEASALGVAVVAKATRADALLTAIRTSVSP